jgi:hypothetical protein
MMSINMVDSRSVATRSTGLVLVGKVSYRPGLLLVCGDQSGRTSAPISPKRVQAMREHSALYVGKAA